MARIRQIKPVFFIDDDLASCSRDARFFFIGLWVLADKAGRLEDRAARMKAQLFPYDADITTQKIEGFLDELTSREFILRYVVNGKRIVQIRSFEKHQHCHTREPDSELPPPEAPDKHRASTVQESDKTDANPVPDRYKTGFAPDKSGESTGQNQMADSEEVTTSIGFVPDMSGESTGLAPVLHRAGPSASGEWVSASGCMDNGPPSEGAASGEGGPGEGAKPAVSKSTPSHRAGDFILTDEMREMVQDFAPTIDLETEAEKFRNYYGRDDRSFPDLPKAWCNWITRAVEFEARARSPGPRYRESIAERNARVFAEVAAEDAAKAEQAGGT